MHWSLIFVLYLITCTCIVASRPLDIFHDHQLSYKRYFVGFYTLYWSLCVDIQYQSILASPRWHKLEFSQIDYQMVMDKKNTGDVLTANMDKGGTVPFEQYNQLLAKNKQLEYRQAALTHLPQIIAEKEYEALIYKERSANYESALVRSHTQLANVIKSSLTQQSGKCPKCDGDQTKRSTSKIVSNTGQSMPEYITVRLSSEGSKTRPGRTTSKDKRPKLSVDSDSPVCQTSTEVPKSELSQPRSFLHFDIPEVSKENFDKVCSELAKTKQALRKLEQEHNIDVHDFLSCQEYERVLAELQDELHKAKFHIEELRYLSLLHAKSDTKLIVQKNLDLHSKITKLERHQIADKAQIEAYFTAYKKVREEYAALEEKYNKLQGSKPVTSGLIGPGEELVPTKTNDTLDDVDAGSLNQEVGNISAAREQELLKKLDEQQQQIDELNRQITDLQLRSDKLTQDKDSLDLKNKNLSEALATALQNAPSAASEYPESIHELHRQLQTAETDARVAKHDLKSCLEEKEVLIIQMKLFHEDYNELDNRFKDLKSLNKDLKLQISELDSQLKAESDERRRYQEENRTIKKQLNKQKDYERSPSLPSQSQGYHSQSMDMHGSSIRSHDEGLGSSIRDKSHSTKSYISRDSGFESRSSHSSSTASSHRSHPSTIFEDAATKDYVCPNCWETFKIFEKAKFEDHKKKCINN